MKINIKPNKVFNETIDGQIEYQIQHVILPSILFDKPIVMVNELSEKFLLDIYTQMYVNNKVDISYDINSFTLNRIMIDKNHFLCCCELPKPKYTPLCYRIYFLFDKYLQKLAYYTIEKGPFGNGGFLCGWDNKGNHLNYKRIEDLEWKENYQMYLSIEANIIADMYMKGE